VKPVEMMQNRPTTTEQMEEWFAARIAKNNEATVDDIDWDAPFFSLNLSSVDLLEIVAELEDLLGLEIESTIPWDYPNIRALSAYLIDHVAKSTGKP
jgi:acyl carrier protein